MPMPFLESPFPNPDSDMFTPPAIGRVSATAGTEAIAPLIADAPHGEALAWRYWAALQASAASRATLAAPVGGRPEPVPHSVIAQGDTLRLHHEAPLENPFESLLSHVVPHH